MTTYLIKNYVGIFQFRRFVPADLIEIIGTREIRRSLKTRDPRLAKFLCAAYSVECENYFITLREKTMPKRQQKELFDPKSVPRKIEIGSLRIDRNGITVNGVKSDPTRPDEEIKAFKAIIDHAAEKVPLLAVDNGVGAVGKKDLLLSKVFEHFIKDRTANKWPAGRVTNAELYRGTFRLFTAVIGDKLISEYTIDDGEKTRETFLKLPAGWMRNPAISKLPYKEAMQLPPEFQKMNPSTVRDHLTRLNTVFQFAGKKNYSVQQIFADLPIRGETTHYEKFAEDDITTLFNPSTYQKFQRKGKSSHYFAALLGLFTGCRLGEIFFLTPDAVLLSADGIPFIMIDRHDGSNGLPIRNVKTKMSIRPIPIHDKLVELGFLDFVEYRRNNYPNQYLFPEYKIFRGQAGSKFGDHFKRYRESCGIGGDRTKVFHSFRHTFTETLQKNLVSLEMRQRLLGHASGELAGDVYGGNFHASDLKAAIDRLGFEKYLEGLPPYREMCQKKQA